jgi:hypothetical protein
VSVSENVTVSVSEGVSDCGRDQCGIRSKKKRRAAADADAAGEGVEGG